MINLIRPVIKEVYNTDMDAIRTLSDFAKKISDGNNLNIPGNLIVSGNITGSGALNISGNITGSGTINVSGTINGNHIYTKTLDIKGKHGTTHFNYNNSGGTYLRDDVYAHDYLETNRLNVKNNVNIAGHLTGTNFIMNTGGGAQIATYSGNGQFIMKCAGSEHSYKYIGAGACSGKCDNVGIC